MCYNAILYLGCLLCKGYRLNVDRRSRKYEKETIGHTI